MATVFAQRAALQFEGVQGRAEHGRSTMLEDSCKQSLASALRYTTQRHYTLPLSVPSPRSIKGDSQHTM